MKRIAILVILISIAVLTQALAAGDTNAGQKNEGAKPDAKLLNEYRRTLRYGTPSQKAAFFDDIGKADHPAIPLIAAHFPKERSAAVKNAIIELFKKVDNETAAKKVLDAALEDEDDEVVQNAYTLFAYYPGKEYEDALIKGLDDAEGERALNAIIRALGEIESKKAGPVLITMYEEADERELSETTRQEIIRSLGKIGTAKAEPLIRDAVNTTFGSEYTRYIAIIALGSYPNKENFEIIKELIETGNPELAARAVAVLPEFKDVGDVKEMIFTAATSDIDRIRAFAVRALKDYKSADAKELLLYRVQKDSAVGVKIAAVEALGDYVDDADVVEALRMTAQYGATSDLKAKAAAVLKEHDIKVDEDEE